MMASQHEIVIVTGSSGFIGAALINKLSSGFSLVGFDRMALSAPPPAAECVCIDLTSEDAFKAAFERVHIAYGDRIASVIHLAAYYDLSGEPSPLYQQITVRGTERLLEHLQGFEVEQLIFSSTVLVHAPTQPGQTINEDSPIDPRWAYPQSKVETEALIREKHGNIPVVLLRLAGVYDDQCHSAFLSQQIARIYERQLFSHLYPGDIHRGQASVHLDDVTGVVAGLIEKRRELPKELTLLVGEPKTLSYDEVQRLAGRLIHSEEWETREIPKSLAKTGAWIEDKILDEEPFIKPWMVDMADDHYAIDITRARTQFPPPLR
jgi:nucleoside-diphosphate-sugar epimerase